MPISGRPGTGSEMATAQDERSYCVGSVIGTATTVESVGLFALYEVDQLTNRLDRAQFLPVHRKLELEL